MKKVFAILLSAVMVFSFAACSKKSDKKSDETTAADAVVADEKGEGVMTYAEYAAAPLDAEVVIECYVQDTQSWWDGKITVYAADQDGAYFIYEMACSEEDAAKLADGQKIKVTGFKTEWSGEVEVASGATFEFEDGSYIADVYDATDIIADADILATHINQKVAFNDMTVVSVAYKGDEPGDDIYVTLSKDGAEYNFCLEYYLNGSDEAFYNTVGSLEAGQVVDVEAFLYYYNDINPHLTAVTVK